MSYAGEMNQPQKWVAREYLRVSRDQSAKGRSPAQQHEENAASVKEQGWELHPEPYKDNDRSASRYARKKREDFDRLVEDIKAGTFDANVLVLWELSRGSRKVSEWTAMLEMLADTEIRIWVTSTERLYDPATDEDADDLLQSAVDSQRESTKTSKRITRDMKSSATEGLPHGKKLYGYDREYDPKTRELKRVFFVEHEAAVVREAGERVLKGHTFYEIASDFNMRGIPPRRESFKAHRRHLGWTSVAIRQMLEMESYGGKRVHRPKKKRKTDPQIVKVVDGKWPAMFDQDVWERIQVELEKRRTVDSRGNQVKPREANWDNKHLMSGLAVCAECGAILRVGKQNSGRREPMLDKRGRQMSRVVRVRGEEVVQKRWLPGESYSTYVCAGVPGRQGFHVAVKESLLDTYVERRVIERLSSPVFLAALGAAKTGKQVDAERQALLDEIEADRAYLEEVAKQAATTRNARLLFEQQAIVQPRIDGNQRRLEALVETDPLVIELAKEGVIEAAWEEMTLQEKRRIIKAVCRPRVSRLPLERRGKRGLFEERIDMGWL